MNIICTSKKTLIVKLCIMNIMLLTSATTQMMSYSPPITIDDAYVNAYGNVIIGNFAGTLNQPAINVITKKPITIINSNVTGPADLISSTSGGADIQVINTTALGTNPNVKGQAKGRFIRVENVANLLVKNCLIQQVRIGAYVNRYAGNFTPKNTIKYLNNKVINIDGRYSNGNNGYLTTEGMRTSHAFQFNTILNVPHLEIAWNEIINTPGASFANDVINVYNSSGTASSHVRIHDNYVQGAYPVQPGVDTSYVGGGIICDGQANDPALATAFVDLYNNQVVASGNYGMAIASGHDNTLYANRIVCSGTLPNGKLYTTKYAVGTYNWNANGQAAKTFYNNIVRDNNPVGLVRPDASNKPQRSDWWLPGQKDSARNVSWKPYSAQSPTNAHEAQEYQLWLRKVKNNQQQIGIVCNQ